MVRRTHTFLMTMTATTTTHGYDMTNPTKPTTIFHSLFLFSLVGICNSYGSCYRFFNLRYATHFTSHIAKEKYVIQFLHNFIVFSSFVFDFFFFLFIIFFGVGSRFFVVDWFLTLWVRVVNLLCSVLLLLLPAMVCMIEFTALWLLLSLFMKFHSPSSCCASIICLGFRWFFFSSFGCLISYTLYRFSYTDSSSTQTVKIVDCLYV